MSFITTDSINRKGRQVADTSILINLWLKKYDNIDYILNEVISDLTKKCNSIANKYNNPT
jgi:hypothetical protein